jgi:GxxExxY protein
VLKKHNDLDEYSESLARDVVDCVFQVHKNLGPGYPERIYEAAVVCELDKKSLRYEKQKTIKVLYPPNIILDPEYRLDLVVEATIVIELKCVEKILPVHEAQLLSYMRMASIPMGFVINFNVPLIKDGIKRHVLRDLRSFESSLQKI